ncbi:recombinase family protein [Candidatus Saccharibacteria bacterium]|nr:recombinase family protein [Candidatus Saccharibacteria bacterium]
MNALAIASCRVSSTEQLENNSLNRQRDAVLKAAQELGVTIPEDGWWSGSVSSKRGNNINRKDIKEMLAYAKKKRGQVKFLIVDEPDRFMRSIDEASYFEVLFRQSGVTVWYASNPELNKQDLGAKLLKFSKYFSAEGSNEERINKSISGGIKAIQEGRLPSRPKPGYQKSTRSGVHNINPLLANPLRLTLVSLAHRITTPTQALKDLNETDFGKYYSKLKMDSFRRMACDPYYAGIIDLGGKFNVRNENGLHEPLISREDHEAILRVFDRNPKNQTGHHKNKNQVYPLSNKITCDDCERANKQHPRITSCPLNNGKKRSVTKYYEKYRCRGCYRYMKKDDVHEQFSVLLDNTVLEKEGLAELRQKLVKAFNAKHQNAQNDIRRLETANTKLQEGVISKVDAATDPDNAVIKQEILQSIQRIKDDISKNETKIESLRHQHDNDLGEFLDFAFGFLKSKGSKFFELTEDDMQRCKLLVFPDKIYIDKDGKVYTNQISPIFRGRDKKKDLLRSSNSIMVRVRRL